MDGANSPSRNTRGGTFQVVTLPIQVIDTTNRILCDAAQGGAKLRQSLRATSGCATLAARLDADWPSKWRRNYNLDTDRQFARGRLLLPRPQL